MFLKPLLPAPLLLMVLGSENHKQQVLAPLLEDGHRYFTHDALEDYSLRVKEQINGDDTLVYDAGSRQYTGWLDASSEKSLFFCEISGLSGC